MSSDSLFIPDNPDQDLGLNLLSQMIGSGNLLEGTGPIRHVIHQMLAIYSSAMLVIAGFVVIYYLILTTVDAAQTGKAFRRINPLWGPLRLVIAIGLLVPLPMAGTAGFNSGQHIVIKAAEWGSGLASRMWMLAVGDIATIKPMVAIPKPAPAISLVRALVLKDACVAITTLLAQQASAQHQQAVRDARNNELPAPAAPAITLYPVEEMANITNADESVTTPYGWADRPFFCGGVTVFPPNPNKDSLVFGAIRQAHEDAMVQLSQYSKLFASDYLSVFSGQPAQSEEDNRPRRNPSLMAERYEATIAGALNKEFLEKLDAQIELARRQTGQMGWVGAPSYLDNILRLNLRLLALSASLPQVDPPELLLNPPLAPATSTATPSPEYRIYQFLTRISESWGATPSVPAMSGAGLSGLSALLSHAVTVSRQVPGIGSTGHQLRAARDLLRTNDYDWASFGRSNPLVSLSELGAYLTGKSAELLAGAGILNNVGPVTGPTVTMITVLGVLAFLTSVALLMLLPLIPLVRFFLGMAIWLVQVFEALIAIPLVALAHLKADEDGLAGQSVTMCYIMVLQVILRPVLMIFGLLGSLVILLLMLSALNRLFATIIPAILDSGQMASLWFVLMTAVYAILVLGLANASFKLIDWLPERTLSWMAGFLNRGPGYRAPDEASAVTQPPAAR